MMGQKSLLIFVVMNLCVTAWGGFIPHTECVKETLEPCKTHPTLPGSVLCENIQDIRTFMRVARCASKKNMQEIYLEESTIDYLPLYILDFCGFFSLSVKSVALTKLLEGNPLVRLQQLSLNNVNISRPWNWEPLSVLKRLVRFSVANMPVQILDGGLIDNLNENLQSLILLTTQTVIIAENAFEKFRDLIYLSIQNNEITKLKRDMFPRPAKIRYFYFQKNKISSLPENIFDDMPHLEIIGLQGNMLSEIFEPTFKRIWRNLSAVLLEGNPLKCHCKMLWLLKRGTPTFLFKGNCYAPKRVYGKHLNELTVFDFRCVR